MKILFLLDSRFDGNALAERPLGGTETALIGVSRELVQRDGVEVTVCADVEQAGRFDGVDYIPLATLATWRWRLRRRDDVSFERRRYGLAEVAEDV